MSRPNSFSSWAAVAGSHWRSPHSPAMGSPITFTIRKINSVAPKKTGIICSSRRITYRPTEASRVGGLRDGVRPGAGVRGPGRTPPNCYGVT
ncbi:hypothetical protein STANM309S_06256 [Streptomyces tanashiensis]